MTDNSYYRPRSPDFSSYQQQQQQQQQQHIPSYPPPAAFNNSNQLPQQPYPFVDSPLDHRASYDASPFFSPQYQRSSFAASSPSIQYQPQQQQQYIPPPSPFVSPSDAAAEEMARRSARLSSRAPVALPSFAQPTPPILAAPTPPPTQINPVPQRQEQQQQQEQSPPPAPPKKKSPAAAAGVEVRTKFPVARIKRIMQADEDVGKVAQVTPIAVCKYLFFNFPFFQYVH